ncbi:MAG: hypothetical protein KGQ59_10610 [Bdellovibrionales bacterium]|nr:hypothetical protein [Bdellovibrionales bacterium]
MEEPSSEKDSSPLATGFWWGFWGLLVLIVASWFVKVPVWESNRSTKQRKISLFQEEAQKKTQRKVAGDR